MTSIFPVLTLDREVYRWSAELETLTPVENHDGVFYKREDYFAPLGYGGPNGSKLRQLIYLTQKYIAERGIIREQPTGIITGASVLSPQLSMAALVARHYGIRCTIVLGATKPETARKHPNVDIAAQAGARFVFTPVGFNPALQGWVDRIWKTEEHRADMKLCYGITTPADAPARKVGAFHGVGAKQTRNIPEGVRTLIMTAGSCNTCVSVLCGLAAARPESLEKVILIGIGPTRLQWIEDRLEAIESISGIQIRSRYRRAYLDHAMLEEEHQTDGPILLEHHDLHARGAVNYQDKVLWRQDGIDFHPTYEGKMMRYLKENRLLPRDDSTLVWIVGSAPSRAAITEAFIRDGIL
jgi:1-aminocyclopropane-1-carboxylate deaminase/D-cysteine desulfhydrase-like pyridoxal-dependent ACC family enzyme